MRRLTVLKASEPEELTAQVDIFILEKTQGRLELCGPEYSDVVYVPETEWQDAFWYINLWWDDGE